MSTTANSKRAKRSNANKTNQLSVLFAVGNTYNRVPDHQAKLDRTGQCKKVHDWTLYIDVLDGDVDWINHVEFCMGASFQPQKFVCYSPINVVLPDGSRVQRFHSRQQTYAAITPTIHLVGRGNRKMTVRHPISLQQGGKRDKPQRFFVGDRAVVNQPKKPMAFVPIPEDRTFGIELELSCNRGSSREAIAQAIQSDAGLRATVVEAYSQAHNPVAGWKLVHDGSIECSRMSPNCTKFELVSPILKAGKGLDACDKVLRALRSSVDTNINVNPSMGFHVHISVDGMPLQDLKKVCQNFVKYEDAMDSFMPPSRRTGSSESDRYFQSCKAAIRVSPRDSNSRLAANNAERHRAIDACTTKEQLCKLMNPKGRYYKMNMQNLVTGRQPTIEFRQHSATADATKVTSWVRFCMALVHNSARLAPPHYLKNGRGADEQFVFLLDHVIKDRALERHFAQRLAQTAATRGSRPAQQQHCCSGCASGGTCLGRS